jgi:catechol 2,3-dioxygenase-like lactoylglutathione lyase family enzyme
MSVHAVPTGVDLLALDGLGLAVADPDAMAAFMCDHLGMRELDRPADRVVVGPGGRAATLSLIAAEGPRQAGVLGRLILRVADVERAVAALPAGTAVEGDRFEMASFRGPEGVALGFTLVAGGGIDYDIDHVRLRVSDPDATRVALAQAGFVPRAHALHVTDKYLTLGRGAAASHERSLLDHVALRVESVEAVALKARAEVFEIVDAAPGGVAVVLPGPERLRLHFVEPGPRAST